jgi:hypothetical protein
MKAKNPLQDVALKYQKAQQLLTILTPILRRDLQALTKKRELTKGEREAKKIIANTLKKLTPKKSKNK